MVKVLKVLHKLDIPDSARCKWTQYVLWSTMSRKTSLQFMTGYCELKVGDTLKLYKPKATKNYTAVAQRYTSPKAFSKSISEAAEFEGVGSRPLRVLTELTVSWLTVDALKDHSFLPNPAVGEEGLLGPKEGAKKALAKVVSLVSEHCSCLLVHRKD